MSTDQIVISVMDGLIEHVREKYASIYPSVKLALTKRIERHEAEIATLREQVAELQAECDQLEAELSMEYDTGGLSNAERF